MFLILFITLSFLNYFQGKYFSNFLIFTKKLKYDLLVNLRSKIVLSEKFLVRFSIKREIVFIDYLTWKTVSLFFAHINDIFICKDIFVEIQSSRINLKILEHFLFILYLSYVYLIYPALYCLSKYSSFEVYIILK